MRRNSQDKELTNRIVCVSIRSLDQRQSKYRRRCAFYTRSSSVNLSLRTRTLSLSLFGNASTRAFSQHRLNCDFTNSNSRIAVNRLNVINENVASSMVRGIGSSDRRNERRIVDPLSTLIPSLTPGTFILDPIRVENCITGGDCLLTDLQLFAI